MCVCVYIYIFFLVIMKSVLDLNRNNVFFVFFLPKGGLMWVILVLYLCDCLMCYLMSAKEEGCVSVMSLAAGENV